MVKCGLPMPELGVRFPSVALVSFFEEYDGISFASVSHSPLLNGILAGVVDTPKELRRDP